MPEKGLKTVGSSNLYHLSCLSSATCAWRPAAAQNPHSRGGSGKEATPNSATPLLVVTPHDTKRQPVWGSTAAYQMRRKTPSLSDGDIRRSPLGEPLRFTHSVNWNRLILPKSNYRLGESRAGKAGFGEFLVRIPRLSAWGVSTLTISHGSPHLQ